jgi:hypothetical protein
MMICESSSQRRWEKDIRSALPLPPFRRLRGYAFDPSLSVQLETMAVNQLLFRIPWEDELQVGPVGEYLEVTDVDPASGCFYEPINLNDPLILAQDGLPPSEGNPMFHQQMVYAVAMTTIHHFERALGRWTLWSPRMEQGESWTGESDRELEYIQRLRIYPHALREANAYYSPAKKALLFGYFPGSAESPGTHLPGGMVFTCLSHDIVAHETTHALLDGLHRRFIEPSNLDTLAFHEAFADIVALFQHFTFPEVLRHQIAKTRGDLRDQNLLGQLAHEFGQAIGNYGALRDAIGKVSDETHRWEPQTPNPDDYRTVFEPHDRGAILVAAVFDAFLSIYRNRVDDLLRIATSGTGVLPEGQLHPDLVNRLADEASKTARHMLTMCIRALDYCPPVDITFGEYLRAIITADMDIVPDDDRGYRVAFIEAFRRRGIYPFGVRTLSADSLRWKASKEPGDYTAFQPIAERLRTFVAETQYCSCRKDAYDQARLIRNKLHKAIAEEFSRDQNFQRLTGLVLEPGSLPEGLTAGQDGCPHFEIHSLQPAQRVGPDGDKLNQAIVSITQKRRIPLGSGSDNSQETMNFRGGCTLILDLDTMNLRYSIIKSINSKERLARQQQYFEDIGSRSINATYFSSLACAGSQEPLAMLHRSYERGA